MSALLSRPALVSAAQELNEKLGLYPSIDTEETLERIVIDLQDAAELVEPTDDLSKDTLAILDILTSDKADIEKLTQSDGDVLFAGRVYGSRRQLTTIMDQVLVQGGRWPDLVENARKKAAMAGLEPDAIDKKRLRAHLRSRIKRGWLDADICEELEVVATEGGVVVRRSNENN